MKIERAIVGVGDQMVKCDVIQVEGKLWLVPTWLDTPDGKWTSPARMISLDLIPHEDAGPEGWSGCRYIVTSPIPKYVLDGRSLPGVPSAFVIVEAPDLTFPRGSRLN